MTVGAGQARSWKLRRAFRRWPAAYNPNRGAPAPHWHRLAAPAASQLVQAASWRAATLARAAALESSGRVGGSAVRTFRAGVAKGKAVPHGAILQH